ncbi:acetate/propionate family kinase, partial [Spirochaetota bacterium]
AKGLIGRIGEHVSEASQKSGDREIKIEEEIRDHHKGLELIQQMLTDKAKGVIRSMNEISACGHRVVHGGEAFSGSAIVSDKLERTIEEYFDLAPLHNPPNLTGIQEAKTLMPGVPQIACFDTAFHQTIPKIAYMYALPYDMYKDYRIRRYGFHGTSHRYVARRAAAIMEKEKYGVNLITCHLGNGCSMAAVKNGKSVDTSMGLTPLEGLVMGTRTGDFDPAIIFYLQRKGFSFEELDKTCNKKSGLLGISNTSNDVRDLESKAADGNTEAKLALDIFAYRIRKYIGSYLAVLNGCNGIVFTGGIGENGAAMRERICRNMENIGIILDGEKNSSTVGMEGEIQSDKSSIKVFVIPTNEEGAIALDTYQLASGKSEK